jgi:uncharacterized integral membrane protein
MARATPQPPDGGEREPRHPAPREPGTPPAAGSGAAPDASSEPAERAEARVPVTQQLGRLVVVALVVLFVVFALANAHHVGFSWVFGTTEVVEVGGERVSGGVPLIVLLFASFGIGALLGALFEWQFLRKRLDTRSSEPPTRGRRSDR